jgi:small GTP-binding protein
MMKKMCVIGEAAVGKTSLIKRFVFDKFSDRYIATIGSKTSAKELQITNDSQDILLQLQIWDIIGLRSFAKLQTRAYKGADGAFIVCDISRKGTLKTFSLWLMALYKAAGEIPVVLLANKHDLEPDFGVKEIEEALGDYGFPYFLTSARTGENVEEAFISLGNLMVKPWENKNILQTLESSQMPSEDIEPELEPGRPLSIFEVEDIIMARYCDLLDDPYFAMSLINEQYILAVRHYKDPSVDRLNWIVDKLVKAAKTRVESGRLDRELKVYNHLIKRISLGDIVPKV